MCNSGAEALQRALARSHSVPKLGMRFCAEISAVSCLRSAQRVS